MHPSKLLIVMALPQESRGRLESAGANLLYTGVGKVNAAAALARRLAEIRCAGVALPLVLISAGFTAVAWLLVPLLQIDRIEARARETAATGAAA